MLLPSVSTPFIVEQIQFKPIRKGIVRPLPFIPGDPTGDHDVIKGSIKLGVIEPIVYRSDLGKCCKIIYDPSVYRWESAIFLNVNEREPCEIAIGRNGWWRTGWSRVIWDGFLDGAVKLTTGDQAIISRAIAEWLMESENA